MRTLREMHMSRSFTLGRFVLVGIVPAASLAACAASMGGEHDNQGGARAIAGDGSGGSKAGSNSGGVGGDGSGASGRGGSFSHAGSSSSGGNASQAGSSGANLGGATGQPFSCGSTSCAPAQYCVIPCCGGPAPACFPASSDGTCPTGSHPGCSFSSGSGTCTPPASCCQPDDCTPPPPYCAGTKPQICFPSSGLPGSERTCRLTCA
jgi:hypothetical protein